MRGLVRTAIQRLALEQGHSVVTSDLVGEAMDRFMPKYAGKKTQHAPATSPEGTLVPSGSRLVLRSRDRRNHRCSRRL